MPGPGRPCSVPFRTDSPSRRDRFSHRDRSRRDIIPRSECVAASTTTTSAIDTPAPRSVRGRAAIFFDYLTDRDELSSNSRDTARAGWYTLPLPWFRSFSFPASVKQARTRSGRPSTRTESRSRRLFSRGVRTSRVLSARESTPRFRDGERDVHLRAGISVQRGDKRSRCAAQATRINYSTRTSVATESLAIPAHGHACTRQRSPR